MSTSTGTSSTFTISGEDMQAIRYQQIIEVDFDEINPPVMNTGTAVSLAMSKWINPWPEFTFDAITIPKYDGIAFYLATPCNKPDFIKDYHYISLMRATDYFLSPAYDGFISCTVTGTPAPNAPIVPGGK